MQGPGPRRLRGLAVEEEGRQGLLHPEVEEVLVHPQGVLPLLVHQPKRKQSRGMFFSSRHTVCPSLGSVMDLTRSTLAGKRHWNRNK